MAKGVKKTTGLWDGLEPKNDDVYVPTHTDDHKHEHDDVPTHKDTHTHEHKHDDVVKKKTTKNKRIQILTYSSLVRRMDSYAKRNALSRAEVFEKAVTEFLERNT